MYQNCWLAMLPSVSNSVEYFIFKSLQANFVLLSTNCSILTFINQAIWQIESNEKSQIYLETSTVTEDLVMLKNASEKSKTYGPRSLLLFINCMVFKLHRLVLFFFVKDAKTKEINACNVIVYWVQVLFYLHNK